MPSGIWSTTSRTSSANSLGGPKSRALVTTSVPGQAWVDLAHPGHHPAGQVPHVRATRARQQTRCLGRAGTGLAHQHHRYAVGQLLVRGPGPELLEVDGPRAGDGDDLPFPVVADVHQLEGPLAPGAGPQHVRELAHRDLPEHGRTEVSAGRGLATREAAEGLVVDQLGDRGA